MTASEDSTARVWDAQTGQPLTEPLKHAEQVYSAAIQSGWEAGRDGFGGQHRAGVGCADGPAADRAAQAHADGVDSAQFSPDGKRVVTASRDNTARVWDAQTGQPLTEPLKHAGWVMFSPIQSGWQADRDGVVGQHGAGVGCADRPAADRAAETRSSGSVQPNSVRMASGS